MDLRVKLGDWFRVVQLLKTGGGAGKAGGVDASKLCVSLTASLSLSHTSQVMMC